MRVSEKIVVEFCALCDWAHKACRLHRALFDDNPDVDILSRSNFGYGFGVLSGMTLEYTLLQVAKLHDRPLVNGRANLTVEYVLSHDAWPAALREKLESIAADLDAFASKIRAARNKALSHNDVASIVAGGVMGNFEKDDDLFYFERLQLFADLVSQHICGHGFKFDPIAQRDFERMASALSRSITVQESFP